MIDKIANKDVGSYREVITMFRMAAPLDLTDKRFGILTARRWKSESGRRYWYCDCDCGQKKWIASISLSAGTSKSCGCRKGGFSTHPRTSLVGQKYGRLLVLSPVRSPKRRWDYVCMCECGESTTVTAHSLTSGATRSCGCLSRSALGHSKTRSEYRVWAGMIRRCADVSDPHYGGRGIRVCDRWADDYSAFFADMGTRPRGKTIDRKDNDRSYTCGMCPDCAARGEPANCHWATPAQQTRNSRSAILNEASADLIRYMSRRGSQVDDLAHAFGVGFWTILSVLRRDTWKTEPCRKY